jgi:hypothetical protein
MGRLKTEGLIAMSAILRVSYADSAAGGAEAARSSIFQR